MSNPQVRPGSEEGKVAVVAGAAEGFFLIPTWASDPPAKVTDDKRVYDVPAMKVCALGFCETARARIVKNGGECLTFDTLAMRSPLGKGTVLLRGPVKARKAERHFGKAPGVPNSTTAPHVRSKGRKPPGCEDEGGVRVHRVTLLGTLPTDTQQAPSCISEFALPAYAARNTPAARALESRIFGMTLPAAEREGARKRTSTPGPATREEAEEKHRERPLQPREAPAQLRAPPVRPRPDARVTFGLRELWALLAVSAVAAGALQFGGNERLDRIAVFRQFMRKSQADLPPVGSGTWTSVGGQTVALSLQLEQVPLSPALLNDFETDARLPFSGEEHLDTPQDSVPETKRWSRFFRARAQLPELPQEEAALEALYLEAPVLTLEVRLQDGRLLLNHSLELLRKTEGGFQVPARLCYALPQKPGPFGAEVLGCETQSTPYVPRSETDGTVDIQLRSHEDPYIVASHLTRGRAD
ncbi:unnamed protein product [Effrenium voratum]|nr:unnamed protein product [Effrenium voratum]